MSSFDIRNKKYSAGIIYFTFAALGALVVSYSESRVLYQFSHTRIYYSLVLVALMFGIVAAISASRGKISEKSTSWWFMLVAKVKSISYFSLLQWFSYATLSLAVFYPTFRCYFRVPYLFCHVCPHKCAFGVLRPYLVPTALAMNLERRYWCYHSCPIGMLHDAQNCFGVGTSRVFKPWVRWGGYLALLFTAMSYFLVSSCWTNQEIADNWYGYFALNLYSPSVAVLLVVGLLLLIGVRYRRPFCNLLCPVGNTSMLIQQISLKGGRYNKREFTNE